MQAESAILEHVYIIAEAGVNHNGDIDTAKELIICAKECGADCVKFQTFKAERVATILAPKADYQLTVTDKDESQIDMLRKLELDMDSHLELMELCRKIDIDFLSTPYSVEDVLFLEELGVRAYKVASGQIIEPAFLEAIAMTGKPMIISTGMATLAEVRNAVRVVHGAGNQKITLLQCTTNYPSRIEDSNLRGIRTMAHEFGVAVGYSDHTQTNTACLVAVGMGARVIEKHLTLDKNLHGPDHAASASPDEFSRLVALIREAELSLGSGIKEPCAAENVNANGMRRSIVSRQDIKAGDILRADMLTVKRPGTGIKPSQLTELVGKVAIQDIAEDKLIGWHMVQDSDD